MSASVLVQARIDGLIKKEAASVLAAIGLTVSDAVRLLLVKVAREHALPFEPHVPNEATMAAIKEVEEGKSTSITRADLKKWWDEA